MTKRAFDPRWQGASIPKQHWHFHQQLFARYGIVLEAGEFSQMLRDIKNGRTTIVDHPSPESTVHSIVNSRLWERYFVLVTKGRIVTALPASKKLKRLRRKLP